MEKCELRPWEIDNMTLGQLGLYFSDGESERLSFGEVKASVARYWEKVEAQKIAEDNKQGGGS